MKQGVSVSLVAVFCWDIKRTLQVRCVNFCFQRCAGGAPVSFGVSKVCGIVAIETRFHIQKLPPVDVRLSQSFSMPDYCFLLIHGHC